MADPKPEAKSTAPVPAQKPVPPVPPPPPSRVFPPGKAVEEPGIKTVIVEEPTLRDQVQSKLNIMLRADSWKERRAIANSIIALFPPQPEDTDTPE